MAIKKRSERVVSIINGEGCGLKISHERDTVGVARVSINCLVRQYQTQGQVLNEHEVLGDLSETDVVDIIIALLGDVNYDMAFSLIRTRREGE